MVDDKKIVLNIIDYLNKIEERLKILEIKISELNDVELVNKLDIINLKDEIEQIKMIKGIGNENPSIDDIMGYIHDISERLKNIENSKSYKKKLTEKLSVSNDNEKKEDGKKCPQCGAVLPKNAKFCSICGAEIK